MTKSALLRTFFIFFTIVSAKPALAEIYVTGSVSYSSSNVPLQTYESRAGSASLGVDILRYLRVGITHRQEQKVNSGWERPDSEEESATTQYSQFQNTTYIISNSLDLTLILYEGQFFVPYLSAGAVIKHYDYTVQKESEEKPGRLRYVTPPVPNLGAGIGMRLNRQFTLKVSYSASPGIYQEPNGVKRGVWDKYTSLALTYRL
jgi:hypothetical protein